ncbi:Valyl-tRNA synthetase [Candidatus Nasuia deltocephalinicola]|nr:Valyl-tRNA synthetase [Candidatus Nasuia deltocephalinicola]
MKKNLIKIFFLPPPNITGKLHIGHSLNFILTDIIVRNNKIKGFKNLWIPGLDHAGISIQNIIEKFFFNYGIKKNKKFLLNFYKKWKKKYINLITKQIKNLNLLINWKLKYFTLNKKISELIKKIFIRLYKKNLIINKKYLINWDYSLKSTISDIETKLFFKKNIKLNIIYPFNNKKGYFIIYKISNNLLNKIFLIKKSKNIFFYKKKIINLNNNNKLPLLLYNLKNKNKNKKKFLFILKHKSKKNKNKINIFLFYFNLKKYKIIKSKKNFYIILIKSEKTNTLLKYKFNIQWFILIKKKIKNLKKKYFSFKNKILKIIKNNYIKIIPIKWKKIFIKWIIKIKNWCISRQLWIGHKIPIYYIKKNTILLNNFKKNEIIKKYKNKIKKEKSVLDTWFSSSLIPIFSKFLIKKFFNFKNFLKSEILITGYDIIFFWVIRMIMFSLFFLKKIPFKKIYIHGLIVDEKGKKMSKSKGNIITPNFFIKKNSELDIFRFLISSLNNKKKNISFKKNLLNDYKIFYNKLININNFIFNKCMFYKNLYYLESINKSFYNLSLIDKWIISLIEEYKIITQYNFKKIKINNNIKIIYKLIKNLYSNIYIEIIKLNFKNKSLNIKYNICKNLLYSFLEIIKLIYPILPKLSKKFFNNLYNLLNKYKIIKSNKIIFNINLYLINLNIKIFYIKYIKLINKIKNKKINYLTIYSNNFKILNIKKNIYKIKKNIITNIIYLKI